ncbi:unnamed protein product, partial [Rotaria sp. Silwood1]
ELNWRTKDYVTPVKDQGLYGSCWALSTTSSLEGRHAKKSKILIRVDTKSQSEIDLQFSLAIVGPIAVAIDANYDSFCFYPSGVYSETSCSTILLDFSLLAAGYNTTKDNLEYYILKNQ